MATRRARELSLYNALRRRGPLAITQEAFDFDDRHLRRLAKLCPGDRAEARDLFDYSADLPEVRAQKDLNSHKVAFGEITVISSMPVSG